VATDNKHLSSFLKLIFGMTTFQLLKRKLQLNCKRKVIKLCFDKNYAHLISVIFLILLVTLGEKDLFCLKNHCIWTIFDNCLFYRIVFNVKYHFVEHLSNLLLTTVAYLPQICPSEQRSLTATHSICTRASRAKSPILIQ